MIEDSKEWTPNLDILFEIAYLEILNETQPLIDYLNESGTSTTKNVSSSGFFLFHFGSDGFICQWNFKPNWNGSHYNVGICN